MRSLNQKLINIRRTTCAILFTIVIANTCLGQDASFNNLTLGSLTKSGGADANFGWGESQNNSLDPRPNFRIGAVPFMINHHTGLTFSAHSTYGGIRFYNQGYPNIYDPAQSIMVMSVVNGNVGIGTTDPEAKLNVNVGAGGVNGTVGLRIGSLSNYPSLEFGIENDYDGMIKTYGNDLKIYAGNWKSVGAVASENHAIYFHTSKLGSANWSTPKMVLNSEGNLGIGISSPSEKLAVNGNIRAREVKVETANWPDYVFAKDYHLPTLEQTKQHIREKGHLPGIPSAEEVKANGVDLGDMNAKLLKKIEEMTLYLIELSDTVKNQQTEINKLKKR